MITAIQRPFKRPTFIAGQGVTRPESVQRNPNSYERLPTKRDFKQLEHVADAPQSDFITTRCYSASGRLLWDGDHGTTVFALAVDSHGTVYQSGRRGTGSTAGDSLFHSEADGQVPLITAMYSGGDPKWAVLQGASGPLESYGIAVTSNGGLYASLRNFNDSSQSRLAKYSAHTGAALLTMPVTAFETPASGILFDSTEQLWRRVRVDAANNVYAYARQSFNVIGTLKRQATAFKWTSDVEYWFFYPTISGFLDFGPSGLGVASDGRVFMSGNPGPTGSIPEGKSLYYFADSSTSNVSPPAYSSWTARKLKPLSLSAGSYQGTGVAPSGLAITYDDINDAISSVADSGTPDSPTVASIHSLAGLGGTFAFNDSAISINDSGTYCYSVDRGTTSPVRSHEIRDSGNNLIGSYDHGGAINDCLVLPDGKVIVAGERVAREDFP